MARLRLGIRRTLGSVHSKLHRHRQLVASIAYALVAAIAWRFAFLLRFEFNEPSDIAFLATATLPALVAVRLLVNAGFGIASGRWRFAGVHDVMQLALATTVGSVAFFVLSWGVGIVPQVPRSVIVIEWLITTNLVAALWVAYRLLIEYLRVRSTGSREAVRVLIVGAGEAGSLLIREMVRSATGYRPIAVVDDDVTKTGTRLHGIPVLGMTREMHAVATRLGIQEIVIAVPSASPDELRRIVECCRETRLRFKVLPGIASVFDGNVQLQNLRDLRIEDLLGRPPVTLELPDLYDDLQGRGVLITGAAGSIGAELSRQVALHEPQLLLLVDQAETPLFFLEKELRQSYPRLNMVFIVGDIVETALVRRIFDEYAPNTVFHAAAYKHVGMMQLNAREALRNNVWATWQLGKAAGDTGADKFVLVSTDKAVRPTSVMGATKRFAELATLELQHRYPATVFTAVRFGNVLGSNGSVIPIFKHQIEQGEPLTVTDPEATRYFMTIPEAVHLILQATLLPNMHGRIAMLEMGKPMRILELAETMLQLVGRSARIGHDIIFTGLRSGEKLHEELIDVEEETVATEAAKVRLVMPAAAPPSIVNRWFDQLPVWLETEGNLEVLQFLRAVFPSLEFPREAVELEHLAVRNAMIPQDISV